jgi:hypothetical protein
MEMNTQTQTQTRKINTALYWSLAMLMLAGAATVRAEDAAELRTSTTTQGQGSEQGGIADAIVSFDEFEALVISGGRDKTARAANQQKSSSSSTAASAATPNVEFWIYDASVELFSDLDRDGYYAGIDLNFDADTVYSFADVYAVVYLSYDFGPWNEYAVTEEFTLFGASDDDEYFVETELVSGYRTGDYDILIELFDADNGVFIASFGPEDSSQLSYLPLEDVLRDTPPGTTVVVNQGGGGAFGLLSLLALFLAAGLRRARKT